ncbi:MAG: hypothetical protein AAFX93_18005 [Verrucomicrobiota bacterium]
MGLHRYKIILVAALATLTISGCSNSGSNEPAPVVNLAGAERKASTHYDWKDEETLHVRASSAYPDYTMIQQTLIRDVDKKTGTRRVTIKELKRDRMIIDTRDTTVPAGGLIGGLVSIGASELQKELMPPEEGDRYWIYYIDAEVRLKEGAKFDRYEFDSSAISKKGTPRGR